MEMNQRLEIETIKKEFQDLLDSDMIELRQELEEKVVNCQVNNSILLEFFKTFFLSFFIEN
jgi:hypothetical protein